MMMPGPRSPLRFSQNGIQKQLLATVRSSIQCCGTVGTITFCLSGTGTVIKWNHKRRDDKFLGNSAASINILKGMIFYQFFFTAFIGLDTESDPEPEPEPVINSYGSATMAVSTLSTVGT
jgi:hypothetical protein